ncbi:TPA: hypothetical protein QHU25_002664 [Morganella morganii subsp. morganii]|uniref:hypothetical protein n=1 Tax=Morganella morganii TaxID=582 RepID=UPI001864DC7F|nr:hypothetical protein [Morganella morganii]HDS5616102.1 hypothetical protein [Morganella morganii subsp. morganii]
MQNYAPYGCMTYFVKNSGIYGDFLTGDCAASLACQACMSTFLNNLTPEEYWLLAEN